MDYKPLLPVALLLATGCSAMAEVKKPNIVIIYADDLGYGDVTCYNPQSKVSTPNIDKLAQQGVRFTDAHSPSSISGPSRYALMTGCYAWRNQALKRGLPLPGDEFHIPSERLTIASLLKEQGYNTAAIGKWGLGADWQRVASDTRKGHDLSPASIDYSKAVPGALDIGFTYESIHRWYSRTYGTTIYEGYNGEGYYKDGARWYFENGMSRGGDPKFEDFDMCEAQIYFMDKAVEYIEVAGGKGSNDKFNLKSDDSPFFLYYAPHIPHLPHVPAQQFRGTTELGIYGDFIAELDWAVGRIVDALERTGELENTIIIFGSDNGPENHVYSYVDDYNHRSMNELRGVKRDLYEGGHRTPFIISYPASGVKGVCSDRLVSHTDILATVADMLDVDYGKFYAEDSFSFLDAVLPNEQVSNPRTSAIHHSATGKLALRSGDWVFVLHNTGSCSVEPQWFRDAIGAKGLDTKFELFNIKDDPKQTRNVILEYPEVAEKMRSEMFRYVFEGKSVFKK